MFTRIDSERNAKIMKRALHEDRLDTEQYKVRSLKNDIFILQSLSDQRLVTLQTPLQQLFQSILREVCSEIMAASVSALN